MSPQKNLERFISAQAINYDEALKEIQNGRKTTHWMWYVFPQVQGLGNSEMARRYAIADLEEAEAYLAHPALGARLIQISKAMLSLPGNDAYNILGSPDDMKLRSCMTLFSKVPGADPVFREVLTKFYNGQEDERTLRVLNTL